MFARVDDSKDNRLCLARSLFLDKVFVDNHKCFLCKKICKNPVELTCAVHENDLNTYLFGKLCLENYLSNNSNKCPVNNHLNVTFSNSKYIKNNILKAKVKCIHSNMDLNDNSSNIKVNNEQKEGEIITKNGEYCEWTGCYKDLESHLLNECKFKKILCNFSITDKYKCNEFVLVNNLNKHNKLYQFKHLDIIKEYLKNNNSRLLQNEIANLKHENSSFKNQIHSLKNENKSQLLLINSLQKENREIKDNILMILKDLALLKEKEVIKKSQQYEIVNVIPLNLEATKEETKREDKPKQPTVGDKYKLPDGKMIGTLKFIGDVKFAKGKHYGFELDSGFRGKNNGVVKNHKYFECKKDRGLFMTSKDFKKCKLITV